MEQRRVPRQPAGWDGLCHIGGESATEWRDCRIFDISMLGLGIEVHHPEPSMLISRRISVEIPAIGDSVNIRVEGEIRNVRTVPDETVRVGIAFVDLSEAERSILDVLALTGVASLNSVPGGR